MWNRGVWLVLAWCLVHQSHAGGGGGGGGTTTAAPPNTCLCSGTSCNNYCSGLTGGSYQCSLTSECTTCGCTSSGKCSAYCGSSSYKSYNNPCNYNSDCTSCKCVRWRCSSLCSSYGSGGQYCSSDSDCTSCKCSSLTGKCTGPCQAYGSFGESCNSDAQCMSCGCYQGFWGIGNRCNNNCQRYGTVNNYCWNAANCKPSNTEPTTCGCKNDGTCSSECSTTYGSAGQSCSYDTDCTTCKCSKGTCSSYCNVTAPNGYYSGGQSCVRDSDCSSCSCVRRACNAGCASGQINTLCSYTSECTGSAIPDTTQALPAGTTAVIITTTAPPVAGIYFNQLSTEYQLAALSDPTQDSTGCLLNCSNNGVCFVNSDYKIGCYCNSYFEGSACQTDTRPCANVTCLNDGYCTNVANASKIYYTFSCNCPNNTYGSYCENKVDYCANVTCSDHGSCSVVNITSTACKCYYLYEGEDCSTASSSMKTIKQIVTASSIVAFIFIALFYLTFVAMDIMGYLIRKKKSPPAKMFKPLYRSRVGDSSRAVISQQVNIKH